MIRRIHVAYTLAIDDDADRATIDRVMGFYRDYCPVYRSIHTSIEFSDAMELVAAD